MSRLRIFIQARMSSDRFPGKILAPLGETPIIHSLIERVSRVVDKKNIVVLTSVEASDNPLVSYLNYEGIQVFRGSLNNVFQRFQGALKQYKCDYFVRLCADSPFMDSDLLKYMLNLAVQDKYDLISNISPRTFPKGQSIEIMRAHLFAATDEVNLSTEEKEHVFPYFYRNKNSYQCAFLESKINYGHINQCVDTIEDLKRLSDNPVPYNFHESEVCLHHL